MNTHQPKSIFNRSVYTGVRRDKYAHPRVRIDSTAPVPLKTPARRAGETPPLRQRHGSRTRQTQQIAGWVLPPIKARIQAMAKSQELSESKVVGALVEKALQWDADLHYGALLKPVIEKTIDRKIQSQSDRQAHLALKAFYAAEQARILTIHLLRFVLGEAIDELPLIISDSQTHAWENLKRQTEHEKPNPNGHC
jgi:hypothetical protein